MMKGTGIHTIGRRKAAVARLYLRPRTGASNTGASNTGASTPAATTEGAEPVQDDFKFLVNNHTPEAYFGRATLTMVVNRPLDISELRGKYDIIVNVCGGGKAGQAGAVLLALSRALIKAVPEKRSTLKAEGFLTRDAREVERKKYGRHKARKRPQFSKR